MRHIGAGLEPDPENVGPLTPRRNTRRGQRSGKNRPDVTVDSYKHHVPANLSRADRGPVADGMSPCDIVDIG